MYYFFNYFRSAMFTVVVVVFFFISRTYACMKCAKSMTDMKEIWKVIDKEVADTKIHVPEEYEKYHVFILCNDCQKVSINYNCVKFGYTYLKF